MLRHEEEHLRAGDPWLVLLGALAVVAVPWNLAVWLAVHRMRLAIEVDCDRRVLECGGLDRRGYAELLLTVGARRSAAVYGVDFSVGRPFLEERIERMTRPSNQRRAAASLLVMLGALGVLGAAWSLPRPARVAMVFDGVAQSCPDDGVAVSRALLDAYDWST
jgi:beta-lactamase regulating signal transducer with metallopeptidase domain